MAIEKVLLQVPKIWIPSKLEEAVSIKKQFGQDAAYVAGATLLQLKWQAGIPMPQHHINLEKIKELQQIEMKEQQIEIGAYTKLSSLRSNPIMKTSFPILSEAVKIIAAPAVRNRGTVGGNVMWGEGDLIPLLLAMQARLTFLHEYEFQTVAISDWINDSIFNDSLLVKIVIPKKDLSKTFYKKIGRRETFTAAIVTVAGQIHLSDAKELTSVSLAIGGGSNKPLRLQKAEDYMLGKTLEAIRWAEIYQAILDEFNPADDPFVTSNYKKKVAANLIISELRRILTE